MMSQLFSALVIWTTLAVSLSAAVIDSRTGRIPNWLTLPAIAVGLVSHGVFQGAFGLGLSLCGRYFRAFYLA